MKEESRLEALEQELKILKNEIQVTLLEIREQILNHYYPELRAEEPLRSLSLPVRQPVGRPGVPPKPTARHEEAPTLSEITAKGQVQPFSDIFLEDLDDDESDESLVNTRRPNVVNLDEFEDDDDDYDADNDEEANSSAKGIKVQKVGGLPAATSGIAPQTREVDFRQLKKTSGGASSYKTSVVPAPGVTPTPDTTPIVEKPVAEKPAAPAPKANRQIFAALAGWVSDGVATVGKARTIQVVETYATGGKLSSETKNSLMQLIALTDDTEPTAPTGTQEMLALMVSLDQILRDA